VTGEPDQDLLPSFDWEKGVYGKVPEIFPIDMPKSLGKHVTLMHYVMPPYYGIVAGCSASQHSYQEVVSQEAKNKELTLLTSTTTGST
jgi:hypothetical protein